MANLKNIRPSIVDLNDDEVFEIHKRIRKRRTFIPKERMNRKDRKAADNTLNKMINSASQDELDELIARLESAKKNGEPSQETD